MSSITSRAVKGSELTHTELDDNFTNLNTDKLENINSESLSDLTDVNATAPTDGQALAYDNATSKWTAQTISGGGGGGDVVDDTTPQLGGDLDVQNNVITTTGTRITIGDSTNKPIRFQGDSGNQQLIEITPNWITTDSARPNALITTKSFVHNESVTKRTIALSADDVTSGVDARFEITVPDGGGIRHVLDVRDAGVKIEDAYTLPTTDGTANQVITTDGAGTLTWATPSAGGASAGDLTVDMQITSIPMTAGTVVAYHADNTVVKVGAIQSITGVADVGPYTSGDPWSSWTSNGANDLATSNDFLVTVNGGGNIQLIQYNADGTDTGYRAEYYGNNGWNNTDEVNASPNTWSLIHAMGCHNEWDNDSNFHRTITGKAVDVGNDDNGWTHSASNEFTIVPSTTNNEKWNDRKYFYQPSTGKFAVCTYDGNSQSTKPMVAGIFGDSAANINNQIVGPALNINNSLPLNSNNGPGCPFYTSNGDLWLCYKDETTQWLKVAKVAYDAHYNLTVGTSYNLYQTYNGPEHLVADPHNANHFAAVVVAGGGTAIEYFSVVGTTVTQISYNQIDTEGDRQGARFEFDPLVPSNGILVGRYWNSNDKCGYSGITINRSSNTFTQAGGYQLYRYEYMKRPYHAYYKVASHTNIAVVSENTGSGSISKVTRLQVGGSASNINDVTPLGILQTGGVSGSTCTVKLKGGLSTVHNGLTPGLMYGVDASGALVDVNGGTSVYTIGKAINTTSILQRSDV